MTSLSNSLLMIPRELPNFLKVAYSLRYADVVDESNPIARAGNVLQRLYSLIQELLYYRPSSADFQTNREKLEKDFLKITEGAAENKKPICVYFVSSYDHNGAIIGNPLYYYHHYKIQNLQKYFAVAAKLVSSQAQMKAFTAAIKRQYPEREIKFVDAVAHGYKSVIAIQPSENSPSITPENLQDDLFADTASDATILLDSCMTGNGTQNIADEIARKTPGRTILAPGPSLYFSKPVIQIKNKTPRVVSAVHGFAILNAYTFKSFSYNEKMPSQFPKAVEQQTQRVTTQIQGITVSFDVGFGNTLGYCSEDNWTQFVPLTWTSSGWVGAITPNKNYKLVKRLADGTMQWEKGGNRFSALGFNNSVSQPVF